MFDSNVRFMNDYAECPENISESDDLVAGNRHFLKPIVND